MTLQDRVARLEAARRSQGSGWTVEITPEDAEALQRAFPDGLPPAETMSDDQLRLVSKLRIIGE